MSAYRKGLPERPHRLLALPLNDKGYPIPWFVDTLDDGTRDFRIMDGRKWRAAVQSRPRLCWMCGQPMGANVTFVAGPMCGINRTSAEPPCHHDCATYAAMACPFLTLPKAVRRMGGLPAELVEKIDQPVHENLVVGGTAITRNPGVAMLWTCRDYKVQRVHNGYIIRMGEPSKVEWYAEGRRATREEVDESIRTGLPALQSIADEEGGEARASLSACIDRMQAFLPVAVAP